MKKRCFYAFTIYAFYEKVKLKSSSNTLFKAIFFLPSDGTICLDRLVWFAIEYYTLNYQVSALFTVTLSLAASEHHLLFG